jgi:DNA invertase Pin-like site-specific DNA recombinase
MTPVRAAAYVRVSDRDQRPDLQRDEIAAAAAARGCEVAVWFEEKASAKTTARAALDALRAEVRAGKWKVLFVWKLDRLCRSGIRDAFVLIDEFRAAGCKVISLRDPFDLAGPAGDLLLAVFAWAAQVERQFIAARVKAGMDAARRRGVHVGRPRRIFDLGRARAMLAQGASKRTVARAVGVGEATLRAVLRERAETPSAATGEGVAEPAATAPPDPVRGKVNLPAHPPDARRV